MARRHNATRRVITPDPKFQDRIVAKFINNLMMDGKKTLAQRIFYEALTKASQIVSVAEEIEVFNKALENVRPTVEVRSRRVGGATYQVPVEIPQYRQDALAIRWIIGGARGRKGTEMAQALAYELADAYKGEGGAVRKRDEVHRMAEANRAFAHYRW
ncbi:30S ribosomal protein S7 [bacterium]|jgi:small subunit ribosomal protein S7|nr:30S ribosomal protein S7 [bacterium]MBQ7555115.1 30S ribosomal protein S7 [bacterium]MBR4466367.1 30S ribosomal protein S7 [bacterium]MBR6461802.1 30S ribosomal protein S7 [bacterium]